MVDEALSPLKSKCTSSIDPSQRKSCASSTGRHLDASAMSSANPLSWLLSPGRVASRIPQRLLVDQRHREYLLRDGPERAVDGHGLVGILVEYVHQTFSRGCVEVNTFDAVTRFLRAGTATNALASTQRACAMICRLSPSTLDVEQLRAAASWTVPMRARARVSRFGSSGSSGSSTAPDSLGAAADLASDGSSSSDGFTAESAGASLRGDEVEIRKRSPAMIPATTNEPIARSLRRLSRARIQAQTAVRRLAPNHRPSCGKGANAGGCSRQDPHGRRSQRTSSRGEVRPELTQPRRRGPRGAHALSTNLPTTRHIPFGHAACNEAADDANRKNAPGDGSRDCKRFPARADRRLQQ